MCSSVAHCQLSWGCQTSTVSKPASTALCTNASNRSSNVSIGRYQLLAAVSPWFQPSVMFQSSCWATRLAPMNEILLSTVLSIDVFGGGGKANAAVILRFIAQDRCGTAGPAGVLQAEPPGKVYRRSPFARQLFPPRC